MHTQAPTTQSSGSLSKFDNSETDPGTPNSTPRRESAQDKAVSSPLKVDKHRKFPSLSIPLSRKKGIKKNDKNDMKTHPESISQSFLEPKSDTGKEEGASQI